MVTVLPIIAAAVVVMVVVTLVPVVVVELVALVEVVVTMLVGVGMVVEAKVGVVLALALVVALLAAAVVEVEAIMLVVVVMVETDVAGSDVDVSVDVNANMLTGVMAVKFVLPELLEAFRCCAAFACRLMAALNCARVLQAWRPAYHVRPNLALAALPQFPNHEPLRPQQLIFPDFAMVPHFGHTKSIALVVTRCMETLVKTQREKREHTVCHAEDVLTYIYTTLALDLRLQVSTPSDHL